ncbi:hypothetical protein N7507_005004 [Penicillium longicatenatum]|nr:hypothetical protein N7507_005004 [Penicillium longicatenatum]
MEGGFSKAFLMRKENRSEVIAKILCYIASPPTLTIAGEVGALEYIRKHTSIPIPYSLNNSNTVGVEYIIIEKAAGVPLFQRTISSNGYRPLNNEIDLSFCIRPSYDRRYNPNLSLDFNKGPWYSILTLRVSIIKREILRISKNGQQGQTPFYKGDIEE